MNEKNVERLWNANYTKVWVANFMIFFSFMLLTPLLPIYLHEQFAADKDTIGLVLFGYAVMALVARLFSGYVVDSFPRKMVLLISFTVFTLFFVGYVAAGTLMLFAAVRTVHGMPFGFTTVANSTVAIDVLPSSRRTEGIGLYGLSNNLASAISPTIAIWIYTTTHNFDIIFWLAMGVATIGLLIDATVKTRPRELVRGKQPISLDRFFLMKGMGEALTMVCFAFSYGVMSLAGRMRVADRLPDVCRTAQRSGILRCGVGDRTGERTHVPGISEYVCESGAPHAAGNGEQLDTGGVGCRRGTRDTAGRCAERGVGLRSRLLGSVDSEPDRVCGILAVCERSFHAGAAALNVELLN